MMKNDALRQIYDIYRFIEDAKRIAKDLKKILDIENRSILHDSEKNLN